MKLVSKVLLSVDLLVEILPSVPQHFAASFGQPQADEKKTGGEIYEPFMGLKSQVELTPPRPGQLGR